MTALWFRTDLIATDDASDPHRVKLVDTISGRVAKISRRDLATLRDLTTLRDVGANGTRATDDHSSPSAAAVALVNDAIAMGLMNRRAVPGGTTWYQSVLAVAGRLVCVRLPLFSIDPIAHQLSRRCDLLFHPLAIAFWILVVASAAGSVMIGWDRALESAGRMQLWGDRSTAGWVAIAAIFVLTKMVHELAHATACRRAGVACGEIGLMFFVGMPCPYCDVSLVSRLDSAIGRAGVMLAGIYVELVVAALATVIWWISPSGPIEAMALNVMIVCGISTLVFNANPLMRMDGYYVLSDIVGTSNLRAKAATAWQRLVSSRLGNWSRGRGTITIADCSLATYHAASAVYRLWVMIAIGWMVLSIADSIHLRPLGMAYASLLVVPMSLAAVAAVDRVLCGKGPWQQSHWVRRGAIVLGVMTIVAVILFTPLRREIVVTGMLDVADATPIHASQSGWIIRRHADFETIVSDGQPLWQLDDPRLRLEQVAWDSRKRLAELQSLGLRRSALHDDSPDLAWDLDAANRRLVETHLQSLADRKEKLTLRSPASGVLLPPPTLASPDAVSFEVPRQMINDAGDDALSTSDRYVTSGEFLGRIGDPNRLAVTLRVDARHRRLIRPGQSVRVIGDFGDKRFSPWSVETVVGTISEIRQGDRSISDVSLSVWNPSQMHFDLRCDLADDVASIGLPGSQPSQVATLPIGAEVIGRIHVGDESLWNRAVRAIRESIGE
jgi:putative peptide zinc metalloprotease protein